MTETVCCEQCRRQKPNAIVGQPLRVVTGGGSVPTAVGWREIAGQQARAARSSRDRSRVKSRELSAARAENVKLRAEARKLRAERGALVASLMTAYVHSENEHQLVLARIRSATGCDPKDALAASGTIIGSNLRADESRWRHAREGIGLALDQLGEPRDG